MAFTRIAAATAIVAALVVPAAGTFAQTTTAPSTSPAPATSSPHATAPAATPSARHMREDQMRASKLIGAAVYDQSEQKIGSVGDLIVDRDGKVTDVVIGVGGFVGGGDKNVAVPMTDLKRGKDNHFVLNTTKDALKQMAGYDLNHDAARSGSSTQK